MYSVKPIFFSPPLYFCVMHCSSTSGCLYKANTIREKETCFLISPILPHPSLCAGRCDGAESRAFLFIATVMSQPAAGLEPPRRCLDRGLNRRSLPSLYSFRWLFPSPPGTFECCSYLNAHLPRRCFNVDCCIRHLFPPSSLIPAFSLWINKTSIIQTVFLFQLHQ